MKLISISTDRKVFEQDSAVRQRIISYGKIFDELHIIIFIKSQILNPKSETNSNFKIQISKNIWVYPTNSRNKFFYIIDAFLIIRKLIKNSKLKIENFVVSVQDPFETGIVGLLLKLRYRLPLHIQVHTDFANRYFIAHSALNLIRFPLGLFVLSFADAVRTVSLRVAKSIVSLTHNVSVLPILTSPLSVPLPLLRPDDSVGRVAKERGEKRGVNFLTACRLEKEKDLETAIKAFKIVSDKLPDAVFTIVGDGSQKHSLELLAKSLKIESKVIFTGWQNDLENYYKNADVYVSTSLFEGYGMSVIEAASRGLPLAISDAGIANEIFMDEESALVCKPKGVDRFAAAMLKLGEDQELRLKMGETARRASLKTQISEEDYLERYKASIEEAADYHGLKLGIFKKNILLRYLVAGIMGTSTNIGFLYVFTDILKIWYLYSSIFAFVTAVVVSFLLQKFWTFADGGIERVHHQFIRFFGVALCGIVLNTALMFVLVDLANVWYISAQLITSVFIAIMNFLAYKFLIFNRD